VVRSSRRARAQEPYRPDQSLMQRDGGGPSQYPQACDHRQPTHADPDRDNGTGRQKQRQAMLFGRNSCLKDFARLLDADRPLCLGLFPRFVIRAVIINPKNARNGVSRCVRGSRSLKPTWTVNTIAQLCHPPLEGGTDLSYHSSFCWGIINFHHRALCEKCKPIILPRPSALLIGSI